MKLIKFNPDNIAYFSEEFIEGFECGAKRQFYTDATICTCPKCGCKMEVSTCQENEEN